MRTRILVLLVLICKFTYSQSFLNGNFENNSCTGDHINLTNPGYNSLMQNSTGYGTYGNLDIITSSTWGPPQNGSWFVAMTGNGTDAISLELSSPILMGNQYTISFYDRGGPGYTPFPFEIGLSTINNVFGTSVYISPLAPVIGVWSQRILTFTAPITANYITVRISGGTLSGTWSHVDNFQFVNNTISINLGNDTTLCPGDSLTLNATVTGGVYHWQNNSTNPTYIVTSQGTYWVTVNVGSVTVSDTIHINYSPNPIVNLGNDTALCDGQTLTLNATTVNCIYQWQNNSNSPTYHLTQAGTYWVKVTNQYHCFTNDTINVTYNPLPFINLGSDTSICIGNSILLDATQPNTTYLWQNNSISPTYNVLQSGTYWVNITNQYNCKNSDTINVMIISLPNVFIGNDTTLCNGQTLTLNAQYPDAIYQWQDGSTSPIFLASQTGTYWVKVTDTLANCSSITKIKLSCDAEPIIPNIITPNGDGQNDCFVIKNYEYWNLDVQIFNRWGLLVFKGGNYQNNWDGTYKGKPLADGTYYYIIKATSKTANSKVNNYHGSLTILR